MAVGRLPESGADLCSQPTISRLENLPGATALNRMMAAMVEVFCDSFEQVPRKSDITAGQCRAARAFLDISRSELARAASVGERTIADFESGARAPIRATLSAIQRALEAAGVEFMADNGVRLKTS